MPKFNLLDIDLRLFDGAGAAGATTGGEAPAPGDGTVGNAGQEQAGSYKRNGGSRRSRSGEASNIVYGKQNNDATADTTGLDPAAEGVRSGVATSDSLEAKRAAFDELINGEYKDFFTERTQQIINRRFKETKTLEASLNSTKPILDLLMQKYRVGDGDIGKLQNAIEQDDTYWEEAAEEAGLTVEQFKSMQKLERENVELKKIRQRQDNEERANQQLNDWYAQGAELKQLYPQFDFKTEVGNQEFLGLLKAGIPVQKAYELIHMDEIKEASAKVAAQTAAEQMTAKIKTKAARPSENGTSSQSAVIVKNDVSNLTREDRARIAKLAQRGETIKF